jgi:Peptidase family M28/PDZ domain
MRTSSLVLAAALSGLSSIHLEAQTPEAVQALKDVQFLSSDSLQGRMTGSPGADTASAYLARRFAGLGLDSTAFGWYQAFTVAADAPALAHAGIGGLHGRNVIAILPGRDTALRRQVIVVGAHYDHLGLGNFGSLDPDSTGKIHNGADDNASGSAALLQIAARLARARPARTVVFIGFSGEELGLLGSDYYVKHPIFPIDSTVAMINLDMVGRLRNDRLLVFGTATAAEFPALLDSLNTTAQFDLKAKGDGYGPSDQSSFYAAGRPVLHFFTDLHEDYHRTTDDWESINAEGLVRVADFAAEVVTALGNRTTALTFVSLPPPVTATSGASSSGYGAYLGTIPDMSENPGGVRLTGVRAGSPAERAGLKANDIIIQIGEASIPDLQAMSDALHSHQPGDVVEIVVLRDGTRQQFTATLGTRGS